MIVVVVVVVVIVVLCHLAWTKNHNFGQMLTLGGLQYPAPLSMRAKYGMLE